MKAAIAYLLVSSIAIALAIFLSLHYQPEYKVINCGIAEISPDFTPDMRQLCRKARMESLK